MLEGLFGIVKCCKGIQMINVQFEIYFYEIMLIILFLDIYWVNN